MDCYLIKQGDLDLFDNENSQRAYKRDIEIAKQEYVAKIAFSLAEQLKNKKVKILIYV